MSDQLVADSFARYQALALRTARGYPDPGLTRAIRALGLAGEAGEVVELVKKEVGHDHAPDPDRIAKELGDVLWYLAGLAEAYGLSLAEIAERNVAKLAARYPELEFRPERSRQRAAGDD